MSDVDRMTNIPAITISADTWRHEKLMGVQFHEMNNWGSTATKNTKLMNAPAKLELFTTANPVTSNRNNGYTAKNNENNACANNSFGYHRSVKSLDRGHSTPR